MYGAGGSTTVGAATLAATGLTIGSYLLIGVGLVVAGVAIYSLTRRYKGHP